MLSLNRQKIQVEQELREIEAQASIEREHIKGANDRAIARQGFMLDQLGKASALVDAEYLSHLKEQEDFSNHLARIQGELLNVEADTLRQIIIEKQKHRHSLEMMEKQHQHAMQSKAFDYQAQKALEEQRTQLEKKSKKLSHRQELEKLVLQYNLEVLKKYIDSRLQDWRVTYDKANEIIFRLVERVLGLGDQQINEADISQYVREAMAAAR
jgi:frataxin-like iron-binding protein CyaY